MWIVFSFLSSLFCCCWNFRRSLSLPKSKSHLINSYLSGMIQSLFTKKKKETSYTHKRGKSEKKKMTKKKINFQSNTKMKKEKIKAKMWSFRNSISICWKDSSSCRRRMWAFCLWFSFATNMNNEALERLELLPLNGKRKKKCRNGGKIILLLAICRIK